MESGKLEKLVSQANVKICLQCHALELLKILQKQLLYHHDIWDIIMPNINIKTPIVLTMVMETPSLPEDKTGIC